jgi:hypothetical protein
MIQVEPGELIKIEVKKSYENIVPGLHVAEVILVHRYIFTAKLSNGHRFWFHLKTGKSRNGTASYKESINAIRVNKKS